MRNGVFGNHRMATFLLGLAHSNSGLNYYHTLFYSVNNIHILQEAGLLQ